MGLRALCSLIQTQKNRTRQKPRNGRVVPFTHVYVGDTASRRLFPDQPSESIQRATHKVESNHHRRRIRYAGDSKLKFTREHALTSFKIDGANRISETDVDELAKLTHLRFLSIQLERDVDQELVDRLEAMPNVNVNIDQRAARLTLMHQQGIRAARSGTSFSAPVAQ